MLDVRIMPVANAHRKPGKVEKVGSEHGFFSPRDHCQVLKNQIEDLEENQQLQKANVCTWTA